MLKNMQNLKFNKVEEIPGAIPPAVEPAVTSPVVEAKPKEVELDDLGYEKIAEEKPVEKAEAKPKEDKIENPASGYDKEPVIPKDEPVVPPVIEEKHDELGFELKVDPIIPKDEVMKLKDFAKKHSLSKEAAQEYLDIRKQEHESFEKQKVESQKSFEKEKLKIRSDWHNELKNDPTFGGEKFSYNILRSEKVLQDFMPGTKKMLTERGSMLPPYVMRDLAKLADHLYSTEKLTQGDPIVPTEQKQEVDDALAYYN